MFQTILNPYDVFRNDIIIEAEKSDDCVLSDSTNPYDYLSEDGNYI